MKRLITVSVMAVGMKAMLAVKAWWSRVWRQRREICLEVFDLYLFLHNRSYFHTISKMSVDVDGNK